MRRWLITLIVFASLIVIVMVWKLSSGIGWQSRPGEESASRGSSCEPANSVERQNPPITQEEEGASVSGTVVYLDTGKPVSSIEVTIGNSNVGYMSTHTNTDGSFVLKELVPNESFVLDAIPVESELTTSVRELLNLEPGESKTGIVLYVCKVGSISGKVVRRKLSRLSEWARIGSYNSMNDSPLEGVRVVLRMENDRWFEKEAVTDQSGHFLFEGLRPKPYVVRADSPLERIAVVSEEHPDRFSKVLLSAGENRSDIILFFREDCMSILGRVTATSGAPIRGAKVSATVIRLPVAPSSEPDPFEGTKIETVSGEDGLYELDGLYPADPWQIIHYLSRGYLTLSYEVRASADGYMTALVKIPAFTMENVRDAIALIERGDEEGQIADVQEVPLAVNRGDMFTINFVLDPQATLSGQLIDTHQQPLGNTRLRMVSAETSANAPPLLIARPEAPDWTQTDEKGQFVFRNLPAGSYLFDVHRSESLPDQRALNPPLQINTGAVLTNISVVAEALSDMGTLQGRVVDSISQKFIKSFDVKLVQLAASDNRDPSMGSVTQDEQEEGAFLVREVSPGMLTLEISASEYGSELFEVEIPKGKTVEHDFSLKREGVVSGHVYQHGVGAPYYYVLISPLDNGVGEIKDVKTDEEGNYIVRQIPSGRYLLRVSSAESIPSVGTTLQVNQRIVVEVRAGMQTNCDFYFEDRSVVSGRFSCSDPKLIGQVHILDGNVADWSGEPRNDERVRAITWDTAKAGAYRIHGLEPGAYTVIGLCYRKEDSGRRLIEKQLHTVLLVEGEEAEIDFDF